MAAQRLVLFTRIRSRCRQTATFRCCNECEGFSYWFLYLMFSRKNTLAASLMLYLGDVFDEEQVISIFSDLTRKNPAFPYWKYDKIVVQLEDMTESEVKADFRFTPSEINLLGKALRIPEKFICPNGTVASGEEGLMMLLKRFAYPCRLSDMVPRFGRSVPELSLILAEVTDHVVNTQGHLLQDLDQPWLQPYHFGRIRPIHPPERRSLRQLVGVRRWDN